ncbi:MAG: Gfo/Idh/MocA family oxidoreductase [Brevinematales bacterium]|jgi:predicted dehydrogenase
MKKLKMGVLGVSAHFISRVLPPVQKSELVEIYAIASRSPDKAKNASEKHDIPAYYQSYEDLLRDKSIDMVYIPLPNHMHAEWINRSADAGKHIICEKPVAMNAKEAEEAVLYTADRNVKLMEAFMYKFHPQWVMAKSLIAGGSIGNIQTIHTFFGYYNNDAANIRNIKEYGGGAILDIGCYASSSARFLFNTEPRRVMALNSYDNKFGTDYLSSGILDFGETRSVFTVSTQTFHSQKVEIHGSAGVLEIEIPFNPIPDVPMKLTLATDNGIRSIETEPADHYRLQFDSFAKALINNTEVPIPLSDAVANMRVLDGLFASGKSGSWVELYPLSQK